MPQVKLTTESGEDVEITVVGASASDIDPHELAYAHGYNNPSDVSVVKDKSAKIEELESRINQLEG